MAATIQFPPFSLFFFILFSSPFIPKSYSQFTPQNIQVFYPFPLPPPPPATTPFTPTPTPVIPNNQSNTSNNKVATAIGATAASTLVLLGLFFLILVRYKRYRKEQQKPVLQGGNNDRNTHDPGLIMNSNQFTRFEGIKGVIVDEEGLDVLYWKNLEDDDGNKKTIFKKGPPRIIEKEEEKKVMSLDHGRKSKKFDSQNQEVPLLRGKSSASHIWTQGDEIKSQNDSNPVVIREISMQSQLSSRSPPAEKKSHVPPPLLLPKTGSLTSSSSRPPPESQVKLKPLHWDKVNANVGHPTCSTC